MIGPANAGQGLGKGGPLGWKFRVRAKGFDRVAHERARADVSRKADEVAGRRIKRAQRRGILLAVRGVAEIADGFEREHCDDVVISRTTRPRVDQAAHFFRLKIWRLFVDEKDKSQRSRRLTRCE